MTFRGVPVLRTLFHTIRFADDVVVSGQGRETRRGDTPLALGLRSELDVDLDRA